MNNLSLWLKELQTDAKPSLEECIDKLGDLFPLLHKYKETIQDPIWHSEGDVHIHTNMVLDELYKIFDNKEFVPNPEQRLILILSALFHDIGKPLVTKEVDGRIKASKHEEVGRDYLAYRIFNLDLPTHILVKIINLVGYHQRPKLLVIKDKPINEYVKLSLDVDTELMYWLELADLRGRTCVDNEESIYYLNEYRIKNADILKNVKQDSFEVSFDRYFKNKDSMYLLANGLVNSLHEVPAYRYEVYQNKFFFSLLCGIPGVGKSTLAKNLKGENDIIINLDSIRKELTGKENNFTKESEVIQLAKKRLKEALAKKQHVVYDATNLRKDYRNELLTLAHNYGAITRLFVLLDKPSTIIKNDKERDRTVSEDIILQKVDRFQFPSRSEASIVLYYNPTEMKNQYG